MVSALSGKLQTNIPHMTCVCAKLLEHIIFNKLCPMFQDVVLDFSKAFDVVPTNASYKNYGIRETTPNWVQNFPTNKTPKIVVDGNSSESACVKSGVPQGTVLRSLLFLPILLTPLPQFLRRLVSL